MGGVFSSLTFQNVFLHLLFLLTHQRLSHPLPLLPLQPCGLQQCLSSLNFCILHLLSCVSTSAFHFIWLKSVLMASQSFKSWDGAQRTFHRTLSWCRDLRLLEDSNHIIRVKPPNVCLLLGFSLLWIPLSVPLPPHFSGAHYLAYPAEHQNCHQKHQSHSFIILPAAHCISVVQSENPSHLTPAPPHSLPDHVYTAILVSHLFCHLLFYFKIIIMNILMEDFTPVSVSLVLTFSPHHQNCPCQGPQYPSHPFIHWVISSSYLTDPHTVAHSLCLKTTWFLGVHTLLVVPLSHQHLFLSLFWWLLLFLLNSKH